MRVLRLVPDFQDPPLPTGELLVVDARRPGELFDVVAVGDAALPVAIKAKEAHVGFDLAMTLLIESRLLHLDLVGAGLAIPATPQLVSPARRLSAAEADYLRALTLRRVGTVKALTRVVLPVRLLPRITTADIAAAAEGDLEDAIAWEIAALLEGRTMAELGWRLAVEASLGV